METTQDLLPPSRDELREQFGFLSFHCCLINMDLIGIKSKRTGEVVIILYRSKYKVGFIYEGDKLKDDILYRVYTDAPNDRNNLERWKEKMKDKVEVLIPIKGNYVFINEEEVKEKTIKTPK